MDGKPLHADHDIRRFNRLCAALVRVYILVTRRPLGRARSVADGRHVRMVSSTWRWSAVLNAGPSTSEFLCGRIYGLVAASFVLAVMLVETTRLYGRLTVAASDSEIMLESSSNEYTNGDELGRSNEALKSEIAERKQAQDSSFERRSCRRWANSPAVSLRFQ